MIVSAQGIGERIIDSIVKDIENGTQEGMICSVSMEGKEPFMRSVIIRIRK